MTRVSRPTVYFDTSAWNAVCDSIVGSANRLHGPTYLFSSCNLDEFAPCEPHRSKRLASFAWRLSNRHKLKDHLELSAEEVAAFRNVRDAELFDTDHGFHMAWSAMRSDGARGMRFELDQYLRPMKNEYRSHLKLQRELFGPVFQAADELGLAYSWSHILGELETGPEIKGLLRDALSTPGLPARRSNTAAIDGIDYRLLPATACWIQYYIALGYLAAHKTGRYSKPDLGDQVDFRHACYAGISDVFVTNDKRMRMILTSMVPSCRAEVVSVDSFLASFD